MKNPKVDFLRRCPCHEGGDCSKRTQNCHSTCQDYKEWRKLLDEKKLLELKQRRAIKHYGNKPKR